MNSEDQLLLACARTQLETEHIARIEALAREPLDWPALVNKAADQRVLPLLYRNLLAICPEDVPDSTLAQLQDNYYVHVLRSNMLAAELAKLLRICAENDIKVMPFKGATLAIGIYGELALRQFGDLDLFIDEQDIRRVQALLEEVGYHCVWSSSWEMHLDRQDGLSGVDLHWAFTRLRFTFPLNLDEAWERREEISLNGQSAAAMGAEDLLLVRCEDGAKDYWQRNWPRLQHLCDVAELIRARPDLDWDALLARAARLRARGSLFLFLALTVNLLDARVPARVQRQIAADPQMDALLQLAQGRLAPVQVQAHDQEGGALIARHMFCLRLKEFVPLPPALAFRLLFALSGLYYRPRAAWLTRLRYRLSGRRAPSP